MARLGVPRAERLRAVLHRRRLDPGPEQHLRRQARARDDLLRRARGHPQVQPRLGRRRLGLRHARARRDRDASRSVTRARPSTASRRRPDLLSQQPRRSADPRRRSRAAPRAPRRRHGVGAVRLQLRPLRQRAERRSEPAAEHAAAQRADPLRRLQGDLSDRAPARSTARCAPRSRIAAGSTPRPPSRATARSSSTP